MTPERQRIVIAEACGWTRSESIGDWINPADECAYTDNAIPDYLNDLNAMHEAEVALEANMQVANTYWTTLAELCCADDEDLHTSTRYRYIGSATALQRSEAFLRTIGKWEAQP